MTRKKAPLEQLLAGGKLPTVDRGERVLWDRKVAGLGLRLRAQAKPVWIGQRRVDKRMVKRSLGPLEDLSLEEARQLATALFESNQSRLQVAPKLGDFVPRFIEENAGRWKPSTAKSNLQGLQRHVVPVLGAKPIDTITRANVVSWQDNLSLAPSSRNRLLAALSGLMMHAETVGLRPEGSNPCAGLRRRQSDFKAKYLDEEGFARLEAALSQLEPTHPVAVTLLRFLMLTGARRGEALGLEWTMIHGSRAVLPDSKTGPKTIWLSKPVRRLLTLRAKGAISPRVFAMADGGDMGNALDVCWRQVRTLAGLEGFRLHDLRHSYASVAVSSGEDLKTLAGLLGHAELATTKGYAQLASKSVQSAAGRVATFLDDAMTPECSVEPISAVPRKPAKRKKRRKGHAGRRPTVASVKTSTANASPAKKPKAGGTKSAPKKDMASQWRPHILAFQKSTLRLDAFCEVNDLNPRRFSRAMRAYFEERKLTKGA